MGRKLFRMDPPNQQGYAGHGRAAGHGHHGSPTAHPSQPTHHGGVPTDAPYRHRHGGGPIDQHTRFLNHYNQIRH